MPTKTSPLRDAVLPRDGASQSTRALVLRIAAKEFATQGFAGARLQEIATAAGLTRAMIYYYFGGREGLYATVLENAYQRIWEAEQAIHTWGLDPERALRRLVEFRVDYYIENPDFVSLVSIENQQEARYLKCLSRVALSATPSLAHTAEVLAQGQAAGVFRLDIDVVDLYQIIVSLGFFNVANRHTFGTIFKRDWADASHVRKVAIDAVLRYVAVDPKAQGGRDREPRDRPDPISETT
jgi:AcrR family transcriptional regulator